MSRLELFYPVKPHKVNQVWGVRSDLYHQFGFLRHSGIDLALAEGQLIRSPFDCTVVKIGFEAGGSGNYICLVSDDEYDWDDGRKTYVEAVFMHLRSTIAKVGDNLKAGDRVARGGSTGLVTGPHTHMACKRFGIESGVYVDVDSNDALNTFDQSAYFNGIYASRRQAMCFGLAGLIQSLTKLRDSLLSTDEGRTR